MTTPFTCSSSSCVYAVLLINFTNESQQVKLVLLIYIFQKCNLNRGDFYSIITTLMYFPLYKDTWHCENMFSDVYMAL